jgi:hypothetical protein
VVDEGGLADALAEVCRTKLNGIAKSDGPVLRGRYDQRAVRREGDGADGMSMALERLWRHLSLRPRAKRSGRARPVRGRRDQGAI